MLSPHGPVVIDWANAARGDAPFDVARTARGGEGRAAMDLSRSESDLAAIYDAMACGVVVRNAAGAVVFANAAAKRIFGRPPEELEGREAPGEDRRVREDGTTMPDDE